MPRYEIGSAFLGGLKFAQPDRPASPFPAAEIHYMRQLRLHLAIACRIENLAHFVEGSKPPRIIL
jgi:hypothetical protein